jgi:transcription antitermination factor NusG
MTKWHKIVHFGQNPYLCIRMDEIKRNWYALKVFYGKVFEIEALLTDMDLETYIPVRKDLLKGEDHMRAVRRLATPDDRRHDNQFIQMGPLIYKRVPVVSSLLFVRAPKDRLKEVEDSVKEKGFVYRTADRKNEAVIPDKQMAMFQLVCSSGAEGLEFFADEDMTRYKAGDRVRVLEGPLKGTEGYIKRIRKDRRLLVSIEGFIAVATSFIPPQFLEKVPD